MLLEENLAGAPPNTRTWLAVWPSLSCMFGFALLLRSSFKHSLCPPRAARCSAVLPLSSKRLLTLGQSGRSRVAMRRRRFPRAACFSRAFSTLSSSHSAAHNRPTKPGLGIFEAELLRSCSSGWVEFKSDALLDRLRACAVALVYHSHTSLRCLSYCYGQGLHSCFQSLLNHYFISHVHFCLSLTHPV
jgi:hypothetical protein